MEHHHRRGVRLTLNTLGTLATALVLCGCDPTSERAIPDPAIPPKPKIDVMSPALQLPLLPTLR